MDDERPYRPPVGLAFGVMAVGLLLGGYFVIGGGVLIAAALVAIAAVLAWEL